MNLLAKQHGETAEITRTEFFEHGRRAATGYNITFAGTLRRCGQGQGSRSGGDR